MKKHLYILLGLVLLAGNSYGQVAMNRPYIDDKLIHFGFSLGLNFMSFSTPETLVPQSGIIESAEGARHFTDEVLHARVSYMLPGFSVGFITDLRLCNYLNLRFTPQLHFGQRVVTYRSESGNIQNLKTDVLSLPISIPLELKWSAEREGNYRPYVIAGGGVSYNFGRDKRKPLLTKPFDYFLQVGAGCDLYLEWFKLCPEIKYQIGFNNVLTPATERAEVAATEKFYSNALERLRSHMITIVFNFE